MSTAGLLLVVIALGVQAEAVAAPASDDRLGLREAVAEALRTSPALLPVQDAIERAALDERVAESRFAVRITPDFVLGTDAAGRPQQQAGMSVSRRLVTGAEISGLALWRQVGRDGPDGRGAEYTLSFTQPLLQSFGPVPRAPLLDARRGVTAASRAMEEARQRLVVRTVDAYFSVVRQQRLADAASSALERAGRLHAASQARARVGLATELDVMRAELLAAQAEASLQAQHEALERARDQLQLLLGRPLGSALTVDVSAIPDAPSVAPADVTALAGEALERRVELIEARDRERDARRAEAVARWALLPDVQLAASYTGRAVDPFGGTALREGPGGWRVGLRSTYDLDRTARSAASARAALSSAAAERAVRDLEHSVAAEVREAHRAVLRAHGAIAIQRKAVEIAERQAALARLRYERGLADNVDLVAAEGHVLLAQSALIGAQADHALALLVLQRAAGLLDPGAYAR